MFWHPELCFWNIQLKLQVDRIIQRSQHPAHLFQNIGEKSFVVACIPSINIRIQMRVSGKRSNQKNNFAQPFSEQLSDEFLNAKCRDLFFLFAFQHKLEFWPW